MTIDAFEYDSNRDILIKGLLIANPVTDEEYILVGKPFYFAGPEKVTRIETCDVAGQAGWVKWFNVYVQGTHHPVLRYNPIHVTAVEFDY